METTVVARRKSSKPRRIVVPFERSVAADPLLLKEYSPRNPLPANQVFAGTFRKLHWDCSNLDCRFPYQATGNNRKAGTGCPACAGREVTPKNNLEFCFPEIAEEYDPENPIPAAKIYAFSHTRVKWHCSNPDCGHHWETSVKNRTFHKTNCPKCYNRNRVRKPEVSEIKKVSFAELYHSLVPDYLPPPDNPLPPDQLFLEPGLDPIIAWSIEGGCSHTWKARLSSRLEDDIGCPKCDLIRRKIKKETKKALSNI